MALRIVANTTLFDPLPQERMVEDQNFSQPYDDKELRRTNPKRHDQRTDWTELDNEKGHDSDVANRYAALPTSVLIYKVEEVCQQPTLSRLQEVRGLISRASQETKAAVYEYVQEQIDVSQWTNTHLSHTASLNTVDAAIRAFILNRLFV